jgi:diguanylate cyclase (GGDEF)-like protein
MGNIVENYISITIVFFCTALLVSSFMPIKKLIIQLPKGALRKRWEEIRNILLFFMLSYLSFIYCHIMALETETELLIPALFFFSAVVVLSISRLAIDTAHEMKRISYIERDSITDHMTGIYNRRYLEERLLHESRRSQRYNLPFAFLLLDIDRFKSINDTYGHLIGDEVLKSLGQLLSNEVRSTDIVARYGGEEIAVLVFHTPIEEALNFAERLRQVIEMSVMVPADKINKRPAIMITVSIGLSGIYKEAIEPNVLIEQADQALYRAKKEGRNKVVAFNKIVQ